MGDWSDWYAREDPTAWVLADILRRRAEEHPDREYLRFADEPWLSYGEVNERANRVANGLIGRGTRPGESVSVLLPNCAEFVPTWFGILKAGAVMSPINTAYKGDFLSWTINLVEARTLVIADAYLDRLALVAGDLPLLERVIVLATAAGAGGPDPSLPWEPLAALMESSDAEPDGVEYSWTDDARIMFTSGTTGRSKGVIKQNAADYFSARSWIEVLSRLRGVAPGDLRDETYFSCLPLFHSNAQVLCAYPALLAGRPGRLRRALLGEPVLAAGHRRRGDDLQRHRGDALLPLEPAALAARPGPLGAHDLRGAGAARHLPRVRGALRRDPHRGLRPHRDRRRDRHGPHRPAAPGLVR